MHAYHHQMMATLRRRFPTVAGLVLMTAISMPVTAQQAMPTTTAAATPPAMAMKKGMVRCKDHRPAHPASAGATRPDAARNDCQEGMPAMSHPPMARQDMPMGGMMMHPGKGSKNHAPPIGSLPSSDGSAPRPYAAYGVTLRMPNDPWITKFQLDSLEYVHGREGAAQAWDLRAWTGHNLNRLWLRTEGTRSNGHLEDGDAELLWGHAIGPWWDLMLGARHDLGPGPTRNWLAVGLQGIAPYKFDDQATLYLGPGGRSALRLRISQEWLFTQRLILEPEFELNAYNRSDPLRGHGAGVTDTALTFRLRYEFTRKFAPYVGFAWVRQWGSTAQMAQREGRPVLDRKVLLGLRIWF